MAEKIVCQECGKRYAKIILDRVIVTQLWQLESDGGAGELIEDDEYEGDRTSRWVCFSCAETLSGMLVDDGDDEVVSEGTVANDN